MASSSGIKNYPGLEKTSKVARIQGIFAYLRGVVWLMLGFVLARGPIIGALKNTSLDPSLATLLGVICGIIIAVLLIVLDTWLSTKLTRKPTIRRMFSELNLSEELRSRALEAFLTKGSPVYANEYYAYMVASKIKRSDNERKRHNISTEQYKKLVTELVNGILDE